jgi:transcriptional antiterminator RfaH
MKSWYLIQTKVRQERLAKENLQRQGYEIYLPLSISRRRKRGKSVNVVGPMFPRYLFINLSDVTDDWRPIRSTIGVTKLVTFGQIPARVPGSLIKDLREREDDQGIQIIKIPQHKPGDKVRIAEGPMEGYEGIFQCHTGKERVVILLAVAQKFVKIELQPGQIETV